jgi:hypothetical protein
MFILDFLPELDDLEGVWTPRILPALNTVKLSVKAWGPHLVRLPAIRDWILRHEGRIKRVDISNYALGADPTGSGLPPLVEFAQRLKATQVVPEVVWEE